MISYLTRIISRFRAWKVRRRLARSTRKSQKSAKSVITIATDAETTIITEQGNAAENVATHSEDSRVDSNRQDAEDEPTGSVTGSNDAVHIQPRRASTTIIVGGPERTGTNFDPTLALTRQVTALTVQVVALTSRVTTLVEQSGTSTEAEKAGSSASSIKAASHIDEAQGRGADKSSSEGTRSHPSSISSSDVENAQSVTREPESEGHSDKWHDEEGHGKEELDEKEHSEDEHVEEEHGEEGHGKEEPVGEEREEEEHGNDEDDEDDEDEPVEQEHNEDKPAEDKPAEEESVVTVEESVMEIPPSAPEPEMDTDEPAGPTEPDLNLQRSQTMPSSS